VDRTQLSAGLGVKASFLLYTPTPTRSTGCIRQGHQIRIRKTRSFFRKIGGDLEIHEKQSGEKPRDRFYRKHEMSPRLCFEENGDFSYHKCLLLSAANLVITSDPCDQLFWSQARCSWATFAIITVSHGCFL
jgi:hypothetical protein